MFRYIILKKRIIGDFIFVFIPTTLDICLGFAYIQFTVNSCYAFMGWIMHNCAEYLIVNSRFKAVRNVLRSQIISGEIAPGEKLPPTDELARIYHVSKDTVSQAMNLLTAEKLIIRRRGVGTFVAPDLKYIPEPGCRNIGIYLPMLKSDRELLDPQISPTTFQLFTGALEALKNSGYVLTTIAPCDTPLSDRLRHFHIAGLLLPNREDFLEDVIKYQLPEIIPCMVMGKPNHSTRLNYVEEISDRSVEDIFNFLIKKQFRHFGVFSSSQLDFQRTAIFRGYRNAAIAANCYNIRSEKPISEQAQQLEYDIALDELLNMPEKPEILTVFRSRFLPGVLRALQKRKLRVPEDISLLLIENKSDRPPVYEGMNISSILLPSKYNYGKIAGEKLLELITQKTACIQYDMPWTFHAGNTLKNN